MNALVFVAVILVVMIVCTVCEKRRQAAFQEQFPPISDAEFIALCGPGTDPVVALKVRRILSDCLCVEYERIHPSASLNDLGAE